MVVPLDYKDVSVFGCHLLRGVTVKGFGEIWEWKGFEVRRVRCGESGNWG